MKSKFAWVILSCLMVLSLILASCAPAVTEEEEEEEVVAEEEEEEEAEEEAGPEVPKYGGEYIWAPATEVPKYGGVLTLSVTEARLIEHLDASLFTAGLMLMDRQVSDSLLGADWTRGPAGTNEIAWDLSARFPLEFMGGHYLAESWELVDGDTFIFHIRKGVHFHDKPPVNGRELTAEDMAYTMRRNRMSPKSYFARALPWEQYHPELDGGPWIRATDKYTLEMKCLPGKSRRVFDYIYCGWEGSPYAREMVEKYGNLEDWRSSCGVGPFMLVDALPGSSWTLVRNPNYWLTDPCGPGKGNQLPYLDGIKYLAIYDPSTRLAAIRTGKTAVLSALTWDDASSLMMTAPYLMYRECAGSIIQAINFRVDKPEIPEYDVRVRRALCLAVDNPTIANVFYHNAELLTTPVLPSETFKGYYLRLDEYDRDIQELFEYHPDKAKQLLAEAGYPNGFNTSILCKAEDVDLLSIIADYWSAIGVNLKIDVKESAVWEALRINKDYEHQVVYPCSGVVFLTFYDCKPRTIGNYSMVDDPILNDWMESVDACGWDEVKQTQVYKEGLPYWQRQVLMLQPPRPPFYTFWAPWLKNYYGVTHLGFWSHENWTKFVWIDQDLKEEMIGIR